MILGFLLDLWLGDPQTPLHPVCLIGRLVTFFERLLRRFFPATRIGERCAGTLLVLLVVFFSVAPPLCLLWLLFDLSPWLALCADALFCWLLLASRSLWAESMAVYTALCTQDMQLARTRVARIVGRDTKNLDASGIARATVETVAESTADGIVSPLLYIAVGFSPLGFAYKAVNTMDSMVGYRNDTYHFFGTAAAKLDDVLGFVPARIAGALMCLAAALRGYDGANAWRVFRRDRLAHASPNSAHTEAAAAGALGLTLGGDAFYFGTLHRKPTQGDGRNAQKEDIPRANRLSRRTAWLALGLSVLLRLGILWVAGVL